MKSLFTAALLFVSFGSALASSHDREVAVPQRIKTTTSNACVTIRPLVRYLGAALVMPESQMQAVQRAVQVRPLNTRTPEQVLERLESMLTAEQFARLTELTNDVTSYETVANLAAQH